MIKAYIRSFSFRAGLVVFVMFCALLVGMRVMTYRDAVASARADIETILRAYVHEIRGEIDQHNLDVLRADIEELVDDAKDPHLLVAVRVVTHQKLIGNMDAWPQGLDWHGTAPREQMLTDADGNERHVLAYRERYSKGTELLVAYDLTRLEMLRRSLWRALVINLLYSLLASLTVSAVLIWLLNRHMRQLNRAFTRVQLGALDYRIPQVRQVDEFDQLYANFNRTMDWIRALVSTVKDSSNAIAHDMRTPLSHLRLEMQRLHDQGVLDEKARQTVAAQVERIDELIGMFENILCIAKAESRASLEGFTRVDYTALVQDVIDFYTPIIEEKQLTLQVQLRTKLQVRGDRQLLGQAVMNLIDNACKYSDVGGTLEVRLQQGEQGAELVVADHGQGIAPELMERVTERFFRADSSRNTTGHGLGLSLVAAVAGLHQGSLKLEDNHPGLKAVLRIRSGQD